MASVEYPGNAIPAPGYAKGGQIHRRGTALQHGRLHPEGRHAEEGQGVLPLGTFLKQDATTKQYVKTTDPAEVQGVLRQTTDTGTSTDERAFLGNIVLRLPEVVHVTAANSGVTLTSVLGGPRQRGRGLLQVLIHLSGR
jgi:hypothetical protein